MELKLMMEKLGAPQTHLGLKNMIKEVDEDLDGKLSFREVNASVCQNMKLFLYRFGCISQQWRAAYFTGNYFCSSINHLNSFLFFSLVSSYLQKSSSRRASGGQRASCPGTFIRDRRVNWGSEGSQIILWGKSKESWHLIRFPSPRWNKSSPSADSYFKLLVYDSCNLLLR